VDAPTFPAPRRVARHDNLPIEETKLLHWEKRPEYHPNDRPHQRGDKHWCNDNDGGVDRESRTGEGASSGDHLSVVPALFQTIIIIINNFIKTSEVFSHTITWRYICTQNSPFQMCIAETTIYCMGISGGTHVQRGWSPPRHTRYLIRCQLPRTSGTCRILHQLDNNGSHHRRRRGECAVERDTAKEEQSPLTRKQGHSPAS